MPTRAAAKREAALLKDSLVASMSSPPTTHITATESWTLVPSGSPTALGKRKRTSAKAKKSAETVVGDWDVLPHGLGKKGDLLDQKDLDGENSSGISSPPPTISRPTRSKPVTSRSPAVKSEQAVSDLAEESSLFKGAKNSKLIKKEGASNEDVKLKTKGAPRKQKIADNLEEPEKKKPKRSSYGLTPGRSPFPDHAMPTVTSCEEVARILSKLHGQVVAPKTIPAPSMNVTGCGEVPDILDAILRTRLSAATTSKNSNMALKGLKEAFGLRTSGVGIGSVNWEAVHAAPVDQVEKAIRPGGLSVMKSKDIKKILDIVHNENCARRDALIKEQQTGEPADVLGANHESKKAKALEITKAEETLLSMDHIFEMTNDEAMEAMSSLPGIGVKTASCVLLFCMQRPSFAVDTHVFRLCQLLGWAPKNAKPNTTFSHCEVRIPDELKYSLHQLFIRHGKTCGRCKAKASAEDYANTKCPLEHLVTRRERKVATKKKSAGKKAVMEVEDAQTDADEDVDDDE